MKFLLLSLLATARPHEHDRSSVPGELGKMFVAGTAAGAITSAAVTPVLSKIKTPIVKAGVGAGVTSVVFLSMMELIDWMSSKMHKKHEIESSSSASSIIGASTPMPSTGCCPGCGVNAISCIKTEKDAKPEKDSKPEKNTGAKAEKDTLVKAEKDSPSNTVSDPIVKEAAKDAPPVRHVHRASRRPARMNASCTSGCCGMQCVVIEPSNNVKVAAETDAMFAPVAMSGNRVML